MIFTLIWMTFCIKLVHSIDLGNDLGILANQIKVFYLVICILLKAVFNFFFQKFYFYFLVSVVLFCFALSLNLLIILSLLGPFFPVICCFCVVLYFLQKSFIHHF